MSLSLEMIQVARLARNQLGDSTSLIQGFLNTQITSEGAFCDKTGAPDLYYTVFGIDCSRALQMDLDVERLGRWLSGFKGCERELDFVHLTSLARSLAFVANDGLRHQLDSVCEAIRGYRLRDGSYRQSFDSDRSSVYATFLGVMALQDAGVMAEDELRETVVFLDKAVHPDGAYANEPKHGVVTTPATAAAVTLLRSAGRPIRPASFEWLLGRVYPQGGFFATESAPMPDLLSTAVALHALADCPMPLGPLADLCLDYVDTLWTSKGGFFGNWAEDDVDVEYTFYGLLALGHLDVITGAVSP